MRKNSILSNLFWKFGERIIAQVITLVVSLIIARILSPSEYGVVSIVTVIITLLNVLVSDGLGSALIQKKEADLTDFSTVFFFNIIFSGILYIILFAIAPLIGAAFGEGYELLPSIIRVLSLRLILCGINSVQQAYISREMEFKKFFFSTIIGTIISAVVGIKMAYDGWGVWALVGQYLTNTTIDTIVLSFTSGLKIRWLFSYNRLRALLSYGTKVLGASLLVNGFLEFRTIIIAKVYGASDLAYFDRGRQIPGIVVNNVNTAVNSVLFPAMSKEQNNIENVKNITKKSIRIGAYIMCPMMIGLMIVARPLVLLILTEKWADAVPFLQMFCLIYLFQPLHTANSQAYKAIGRSDIYLKVEVIKKVIEVVTLIITLFFSLKIMTISMVITSTIFTYINAFPNKRLISYSFKEQVKDITPSLLLSAIMAVIVIMVGKLQVPLFYSIVLQVVVGCVCYIGLSLLTKNKAFYELTSIANHVLKK